MSDPRSKAIGKWVKHISEELSEIARDIPAPPDIDPQTVPLAIALERVRSWHAEKTRVMNEFDSKMKELETLIDGEKNRVKPEDR